MLSYVYPDYRTSKIIYWEYENGEKKQLETEMPLYFYLEDEKGEYKTINGKCAKKVSFDKWKDFKETRNRYRDFGFKMFESDISLQTKFICNHYYGQELTIPKEFDTFFIDIEVHSEQGFAKPENPFGKITVITIFSTNEKKFYIFAEKDFNGDFIEKVHGFPYQKRIHSTEEELLRDFISFIKIRHPDILSGWFSQDYDIPYIINRARRILDEGEVENMSPVGQIREEEVRDKKSGVFRKQYFIQGINCIDLMEVYKNYSGSIKSTYNLNAICLEEIQEGKKEYKGDLAELYKNWQEYIEYNIQDVDLLRKLDSKLGYMALLITFCYGCKVPFEHYSKTTRVLDGAFISKLIEEQIVLPDVNRKLIDEMNKLKEMMQNAEDNDEELDDEELNTINMKKYVGGYVATPEKGLHEWIVSFDAESLYPSIMIGWNISPETKLGTITDDTLVEYVYKYMAGDKTYAEVKLPFKVGMTDSVTTVEKLAHNIKKNNFCLAANGTFYRQDFVGVIPKFVSEWFTKRKQYKKLMLDAKAKGDKNNEQYYNLLQWNFKILINSVYGYLGSRYSRFYDIDNARAVTLTGQAGLKRTMKTLNDFFLSEWSQQNKNAQSFKDFVIYGDTDSVYVSADRFLKSLKYVPSKTMSDETAEKLKVTFKSDDVHFDNENIIFKNKKGDIVHTIENENTMLFLYDNFEPLIQDILKVNMGKFCSIACNCRESKISFKRESICRSTIFVEKKKYAVWLVNDEGNVPADKLKVTGLDIVRADTPLVAKKCLKEIVFDILRKIDHKHSIDQLKEARNKFMTAAPEDIAFNKPVNGLDKYKDKYNANGEEFKSTPYHVRAAIIYNEVLRNHIELQNKYDFIYNGDKVKVIYLKTNSNWTYDVMAFKGKWIPELGIDDIINREQQFKISVLNLMEKLFNLLDWELPKFNHYDLRSLFSKPRAHSTK